MKEIKNVIITGKNGEPYRDIADDVVSTEFMQMQTKGKQLPPEAYPIMDTVYLLKRMIDLSSFKTRTEMKAMDAIGEKIKDSDGSIFLEEGDYNALNKLRDKFTPYLSSIFEPFHETMEQAIDAPSSL